MNRRISTLAALVCLLFLCGGRVFGQLQNPVPPVNIIIDSDMSNSVDDVGDHAVMWALANRGEVNVLAEVCSSANDFSAPLMHAIATYYGHPNVLIGAHQGSTPNLENSATSNYAQQIVSRFGIPGDTRANYPDAVTVYRQALANAPDHSVYIVANGFWEPLQGLLQSPADSISPLAGVQLVAQKVVRLVPGAGFFPSGNEHNFRVDADAASFLYANWPVEIVNVGVEVSLDVNTGPDFSSATTTDPIKAAYIQANGGNQVPGFGQLPLLFAVRGLGANFTVPGFNGQTTIETFSQQTPGQNNWFQTPQVGHSYLAKQATAAQLEAILNPLLQSSSNMPILKTISPSSVPAGSGQTITLTGTNFFSDSQVQFNGSNRPTTFVSATQLSVQLSSSDLQAGQQALTVANSEGGGWTSNPLTLTVTGTSPTLTSISPTSAVAGSGPVTLTATGTNFVSASTVQVNGANRATTFVSSTQLTATLTTGDTSTQGSLSITVNTPGSGTSGSLNFTVTNTAPSLTSISPSTATAGGPAFTLTANGSNFVNGATVQVNGSNRTTTFVSSTQLTASIPSSDIASAGTLAIGVVNPDGSATSTLSFTVNNPSPSLTSISPSTANAGGPGFTLTVTGGSFVSTSAVQVNGASRTTSFVSATQLTAAIPASDIAAAGALSITVFSPAPGGGTSVAATFTVTNTGPSLTSISPSSATAGGPAFTLTANGSNFVNGSTVQVNGANRTTTFVSSTQLTASIPSSDIASAGTLAIGVVNPGGSSTGTLSFTVNNPSPSLTSISPSTAAGGGPGFTLTVTGSSFVSTSVVQVNGASRTTSFVSATQLTAAIPASDIAPAGALSITVFTPAPGGGTSTALTFTVTSPPPSLASISPSTATAGGPAFTLTANGSNFVNGSTVQVNGANRTTTFVSATQLTAAIPASDIASTGSLAIGVINPDGSTTGTLSLAVNNPPPSLASMSPTSATAGSPGFTLTVTGSNFVSVSVVRVNGASRTTTFVSNTQLTAAIPASDIASAGTLSITVFTPTPGGGTSTALTFTVTSPPPSLASISPSTATAGRPAFTLTANGSNFVNGSTVQVNGANRTTTFVSATQLTAAIPASDTASTGSLAIGVINPDGSTTGTLSLAVNNPPPSLASMSPTSATAGSPGFTLTVTGSNFVSTSVVQVNGASRTTTFVSNTQLTAAIPASDIASAGTLSITVFTPTPGGGTSTALTFTVTSPPPSLASISPSTATAGRPAFTLTANGSNFVNGSTVQVNGANRTTTFVSATQLTAAIPASDIASTGSLAIGVINPDGSTTGTLSLAVNNPPPSLASMSPTSATAGSPGFTLTVTGSNFVSVSVVRVNGASRTTTFVNSTQLTAAIPASDIASAGTLSITVFTPTPGGGTSTALTFTVTSPPPSLASISPSTATVGGPAFTLTANGSNFVNGSIVQVNGANRTTTFVSATQVTAAVPASDIASTGTRAIRVVNPDGSASSTLSLAVNNPSPSLSSISPASATAGSAGFTLTVSGSNFVPASVVRVNGGSRTTTFVSSTQLTAAIPASDLAVAASLSITVFTPTPGGGTSAAVTFTVNNPVPSISSISPSTTLVLGPSFTLTVNGSGFVSSSVVKVNGSARPTTFVSPTQLQAQISNNDILSVGQRSITVFNPTPGGGTSNAATLTVIGLLGQVTAPGPTQLSAAPDVRPEPYFSLST